MFKEQSDLQKKVNLYYACPFSDLNLMLHLLKVVLLKCSKNTRRVLEGHRHKFWRVFPFAHAEFNFLHAEKPQREKFFGEQTAFRLV